MHIRQAQYLSCRDLTDNPVECACDAVYLHNFFTRKRLSSPVCAEPEALLGANLLDLNPEEICGMYVYML